MRNQKVKAALAEAGLRQWQLARLMGIHEVTLSHRMRDELPEEEQERLVKLIRDHANKKGGENNG